MRRAAVVVVVALALALLGCGPRPVVAPAGPPPEKVVQVNAPGAPVELATVLVPGHVTVVDFWATWCGGCVVVDEKLMAAIAAEPDVVVRKIDVGDGDTPVARQHRVGALPHVRIFDRTGNLRYVLAGNDALTAGDIARELAAE